MTAQASAPTPVYRKLTRMHRGVGTMNQLWLGDDHLLHVMSTGYTETYRRCYLRDIQTMLIVHTALRTYLAVALAVLLVLVLTIVQANDGGPVAYGVVALIFSPLFLWNHLLGAGCRVVVVTAVQQEKIPSLSRLPKTRRILADLKSRIEAAQADFALLPVAAAGGGADRSAGTNPSMPPPLPPPLPPS